MNKSDAPSQLPEQDEPQDEVMQPTDEQGQSEARPARTWDCDASSEGVQGRCPTSGSPLQIADSVAPCRWTEPQSVRWRQASSLRNVPWFQRSVWSENGHVSLFGKKDIRQEVACDVTTESETEVVPRRQNTLTYEAALRWRLRANCMLNGAVESPTTWSCRTSEPTELRCIPGEVRKMGGAARKRCRDRRRNRRYKVHMSLRKEARRDREDGWSVLA